MTIGLRLMVGILCRAIPLNKENQVTITPLRKGRGLNYEINRYLLMQILQIDLRLKYKDQRWRFSRARSIYTEIFAGFNFIIFE